MNDGDAAASSGLVGANLFDFDGPIRINYSSSSIRGTPLLSYKDADLDLDFQGEDITRIETSVGELIIVTLQSVPDAFARTITLIVPAIRLAAGEQAEFNTLAVETTDRSDAFVAAPTPAEVLQTYQIYQLRGTAQHVIF